MPTPFRSSTLSFGTIGEAREWASMMDLRKVRALPETFVGEGYDDDGSRLSFIMRKCAVNEFEFFEYKGTRQ